MVNYSSLKAKEVYKVFADCGNSTTKVRCYLPNGETLHTVIPTLISTGEDRMYQGSYIIRDYNGQN